MEDQDLYVYDSDIVESACNTYEGVVNTLRNLTMFDYWKKEAYYTELGDLTLKFATMDAYWYMITGYYAQHFIGPDNIKKYEEIIKPELRKPGFQEDMLFECLKAMEGNREIVWTPLGITLTEVCIASIQGRKSYLPADQEGIYNAWIKKFNL
ncbi:MAG: hypothetical protein ABIH82_02215 [Candidatus Woesearchaeota archaeon]